MKCACCGVDMLPDNNNNNNNNVVELTCYQTITTITTIITIITIIYKYKECGLTDSRLSGG
jgi:hypothetical protein